MLSAQLGEEVGIEVPDADSTPLRGVSIGSGRTLPEKIFSNIHAGQEIQN